MMYGYVHDTYNSLQDSNYVELLRMSQFLYYYMYCGKNRLSKGSVTYLETNEILLKTC